MVCVRPTVGIDSVSVVGNLSLPQPTSSHGLMHRPLDLALSGDAELFEQLSDARVEDVFLHRGPLLSLGT